MRLQRLFHMGPAEIAVRAAQEASKVFERTLAGARQAGRAPLLFEHLERGEGLSGIIDLYRAGEPERAAEELLRHFRRQGPSRMFVGAVHESVPDFIARDCPHEKHACLVCADAVRRYEFPVLGYGRLTFGVPPDWHLDPIAGRRAPDAHWSRIPYLDQEQVGDSKVVWEINRHQWMLDLGQAYAHTGDEAYAETFAGLASHWMAHNPPARGINWCSSLEVAMRLISWCWALFLFRRSPSLTPALFIEMLGWLRTHARYVERYLSYYFSPNTHLTGEALGLLYAGTLFPELRGARRWRELGRRILLEQLERQVHADGAYFELSTCYQYYTIEFYLHFLLLEQRNGNAVPERVKERLQAMLDFALALRRPDGFLPQIGDTDGGWLLPLVRREPGDFRGLFSTAAALFKRPDYAWAAETLAPETLWLLGPAGREAFLALHPAAPAAASPRFLRQSGFVVMRSGWHELAHQLILDAGPLGCEVSGGHGHADLLSVQISAFGEPFVVDPGTGCYTHDPEWRNYFRSSQAHSTLTVDGRGQADPSGPFSWKERPRASLRFWEAGSATELVDAGHEAWADDGLRHRRRVLFVKPGRFFIVDDLEGSGSHHVDLRYQFAPLEVSAQGNWVRARGRGGHGLLLGAFACRPLALELASGELSPIRGWLSANYGRRQPAPAATWSVEAELPLRIVTLVLPVEDPEAAAPEAWFEGPDRLHIAGGEILRIGEQGITLEPLKQDQGQD